MKTLGLVLLFLGFALLVLYPVLKAVWQYIGVLPTYVVVGIMFLLAGGGVLLAVTLADKKRSGGE
jgi:hypothetical protein